MVRPHIKKFEMPDATSTGLKSRVDTVELGSLTLLKIKCEPGWRWSVHGNLGHDTELCMKHHMIYCLAGRVLVKFADETYVEFGQGDVMEVLPGHDAWVLGNEPAEFIEFVSHPVDAMDSSVTPLRFAPALRETTANEGKRSAHPRNLLSPSFLLLMQSAGVMRRFVRREDPANVLKTSHQRSRM